MTARREIRHLSATNLAGQVEAAVHAAKTLRTPSAVLPINLAELVAEMLRSQARQIAAQQRFYT